MGCANWCFGEGPFDKSRDVGSIQRNCWFEVEVVDEGEIELEGVCHCIDGVKGKRGAVEILTVGVGVGR